MLIAVRVHPVSYTHLPEMKEYTLIIKGEMDFIILSPQVLSSLITQIHNSPERKVVVSLETVSYTHLEQF